MLSDSDIASLARENHCEPEAVKAVIFVETPAPHVGDLRPGKPLILFERHKFYRYSGNKPVSRDFPHLANHVAGGYCSGRTWQVRQECEHAKLQEAFRIFDGSLVDAALMSISMGLFQIMGFNYRLIDQPSVGAMWERYKKVDDKLDLEDFFKFCKNARILDDLQNKNWVGFARGYNGSGYARNRYDVLLNQYYRNFKRKGMDYAAAPVNHSTVSGFPEFSKLS